VLDGGGGRESERTHDQAREENPQQAGQVGGVQKVMYPVSVASLTALERK